MTIIDSGSKACRQEVLQDYGVDCSSLYGEDLAQLPGELARLLADRLALQEGRIGEQVFPEVARLLRLQVCGELWGWHIVALRDLLAVELLSGRNHKSAVAVYIRRCADAWDALWQSVDREFLSRLATMEVPGEEAPGEEVPGDVAGTVVPAGPVPGSAETQRLLELSGPSRMTE